MGEVIEMVPDTLLYITDDGGIIGVSDTSDDCIEIYNYKDSDIVFINTEEDAQISKEKFRNLCVAWLALNFPDNLKFDDEGE